MQVASSPGSKNVARTPRCEICADRSYVLERRGDRAAARVCQCARPCRGCDGSGHVLVKQEETFSQRVGPRAYEVLAPCSCVLLDQRVALLDRAQLPGVMAAAEFDGFMATSEGHHRACDLARSFALEYRRGQPSKGFVLSGPVGTGKTHLLTAALKHLALELGVRVQYVEISLLYAQIRRGFQEGKSGGEIIQPLSEVEVLAIDELGKGRGSQFELETMDELIARRYNAGRTTLFATNYSTVYERKRAAPTRGYETTDPTAKTQARESELLRDRVGERIYSRLCEMCEFVQIPLDTPDHRHLSHERERPVRRPHGHPPPSRRHG